MVHVAVAEDTERFEELEAELERAGDMEILLVQRYVIEVLRLQARHEGCQVGDVLDRALCCYLEANECSEVMRYMAELAKGG